MIVGTAGHIDHGKTALVRALTGVETDRLKEEKARGITIELGFAYLAEAGRSIGFVDVPGHERFVHTMLAGASGIDFALLVDGLAAEREQGITIDVAYRFFATEKRKFIVADTPGHEQYTRNMVTGASTADLGLVLVDRFRRGEHGLGFRVRHRAPPWSRGQDISVASSLVHAGDNALRPGERSPSGSAAPSFT